MLPDRIVYKAQVELVSCQIYGNNPNETPDNNIGNISHLCFRYDFGYLISID